MVSTLVELALQQIPFTTVKSMNLKQRTVVHYEIYPRMTFWSRSIKDKPLKNICSCVYFGRCLCYMEIIKDEMTNQYWADPNTYRVLSDWIR